MYTLVFLLCVSIESSSSCTELDYVSTETLEQCEVSMVNLERYMPSNTTVEWYNCIEDYQRENPRELNPEG